MLRNADGSGGGGGCQIFWKKALRRCKGSTLLGGGWGSNFAKKALNNTLMAPNCIQDIIIKARHAR